MSGQDFSAQRRAMVTSQLRTGKVSDAAVLAAMGETPRERFVGEGQGALAYRDAIVPLGEGRGLNPPAVTGRLLDAAQPKSGERALVVGAATGYVPTLLAEMGCTVTALEESPALAERARAAGVAVVEGPLTAGWSANAPYDLIYIDGTVERVPDAIIEQLAEEGRLVSGILDRGVCRLGIGRRVAGHFGFNAFADIEAAPLPGFAPAPAFTF